MTAHTPPTPPAMRERKLESVCFEASTTSVLTSSAEGIEGGVDDDEEGDMVGATNGITVKKGEEKKRNVSLLEYIVGWDCGLGFEPLASTSWRDLQPVVRKMTKIPLNVPSIANILNLSFLK